MTNCASVVVLLIACLAYSGVWVEHHAFAATVNEIDMTPQGADHEQFPSRSYNKAIYSSDANGFLRRLDQHGNKIWQRRFQGWVYPPALLRNRLITAGSDAILWGLEPNSGEIRWSMELPQEAVYRVIAAVNLAIVTTFDGSITAVDADGNVVWVKKFEVASSSPLYSSGRLYLPGFDGRIRTLKAENGQTLWISNSVGRVVTEPSAYSQYIYIAAEPAALHVLDADSGHLVKTYPLPADPIGPITQHSTGIRLFHEQKGQQPLLYSLSR